MPPRDIIPVHDLQEKTHYIFTQLKRKNIADAAITISSHSGFSLSSRQGVVDTFEYDQAQSLSLTVYESCQSATVSVTSLSMDSLNYAIEKALSLVKFVQKDEHAGLPDRSWLAWDYLNLQLYHPWSISIDEAKSRMLKGEKLLLQYNTPKVSVQTEAVRLSTHSGFVWLANTINNFCAHYPYSQHSLLCQVIAKQGNDMQIDYDYAVARKSTTVLPMDDVINLAASKTIRRLNARSALPGSFPVIFEARVATTLWQHLLSAVAGMTIYREMSFLKDALGKNIFPKFINVIQKPHIKKGLHSSPFDAEGVLTREINYVKEGQLTHFLLSSYTARCLNLKTTGNAGGVYNIFISHGKQTLKDLCLEMGRGYLITELLGQGVNLVTGDYSRGAFGYFIDDGKIQYPVQGLTVAGNLQDMFQNIINIGKDLTCYSNISTGSVLIKDMIISAS